MYFHCSNRSVATRVLSCASDEGQLLDLEKSVHIRQSVINENTESVFGKWFFSI